MAGLNEDPDRQVVPLWRDFSLTTRRGELNSLPAVESHPFTDGMLTESLTDWREQGGLSTAADLVSVAFTLGRFDLARDAAGFVIEQSAAPPSARNVAELYLTRGRPPERTEQTAPLTCNQGVVTPIMAGITARIREGIQNTRRELLGYPRNPVLWNNLARLYTSLGQHEKARRAIAAAVSLAPSNRFVLRSAARFFLHDGDGTRAKRILTEAPNVRSDPWLLAAEIATSAAVNRPSTNVKFAKRVLESGNHDPFHLSELASALGTIESLSGNHKGGRKLIAFSLESPAENAVAQAAWLARRMNVFVPQARVVDSHEAIAWNASRLGNWPEAVGHAHKWLLDQPFSSRPAVLGSYLASVALEDYEIAATFARHGLLSNPDSFTLHNNLAVALAKTGDIPAAHTAFNKIDRTVLNRHQLIAYVATEGMLAFRSGREAAGRQLYNSAISLARQAQDSREHVALLYYAFEELRVGSPDAESIRARAIEQAKALTDPAHQLLVSRLRAYDPATPALSRVRHPSVAGC